MSQVIGIDRKPVDVRTVKMDMKDAATALRALLEKVEKGELKMLRWLIVYDVADDKDPSANNTCRQSSDLCIADTNYMLDMAKACLLRDAQL